MSLDLSSNLLQFNFVMESASNNGIYSFDDFTLDSGKLMLYRHGEALSLPPKVVRTLAVLVENQGTILSKDELIEQVWSDSVVEESNLSQYLYLLRKSLGEMPRGGPYIETLRRRGYRFNGEVGSAQPSNEPNSNSAAPFLNTETVNVKRYGNVLRFVDRGTQPEPVRVPHSATYEPAPVVETSRVVPMVALAAVVAVVVTAFVLFRSGNSETTANNVNDMSVIRLTDGKWPSGATIAPDGDYFAYAEMEGNRERVFVQQVGQSNRLEVISSNRDDYKYMTFSNDGRFLYIVTSSQTSDNWLLRVPSLGGSPVRLMDTINSAVSFSPDGKEMTFTRVRRNSNNLSEWSVIIADIDGKSERTLITRSEPSNLGSPAWSPDGKLIAVSEMGEGQPASKPRYKLFLVDVESGDKSELSPEEWSTLHRVSWTSDGKGIVMIGTRAGESYSTRRDNVFFISYPEGKSRRLTNDGNRYDPGSLGVTKAGGVLAVNGNRSSQLWTMNANGDEKTAYQITRGATDGRAGLSALSDGRLVYVARLGDEINIWISNGDGSDQKQLSQITALEESRADPSSNFVVFSSPVETKAHLFRIEADGDNLKQLTFGEDEEIDSDISPNGKTIVYTSAKEIAGVYHHRLLFIPSEGGEPKPFVDFECSRPLFAPDGKKLSCITERDEVVIVSSDGIEIERFSLPPNTTSNYGIGWLPDSSALGLIIRESGVSNIWSYPLRKGKPTKLTNFTSGTIYRYAFSPDGTRLFLARGYPTQDVILIANYL